MQHHILHISQRFKYNSEKHKFACMDQPLENENILQYRNVLLWTNQPLMTQPAEVEIVLIIIEEVELLRTNYDSTPT